MTLPVFPSDTGSPLAAMTGENVAAHLMNGEVIEGRLTSFSSREGLRITRAIGITVELPLSSLRYLTFLDPRPPGGELSPEPQGSAQKFVLTYIDGREIGGLAHGLSADPEGLHVYRRDDAGKMRLLFIPNRVLKSYRTGPRLGESLVTAGQVAPGAVDAALQAQQDQRRKKLGAYVHSAVAVTADDLKTALEQQANYPARKLGELLIAGGLISLKQLAYALELQKRDRKKRVGDILVDMGAATAEAVHTTLARNLGIPFVKLHDFEIDTKVLPLVTEDLARKHTLMPLMLHQDRLVVAMQDPTDMEVNNLLRFTTGHDVEAAVATREDIEWAIGKHYGAADVENLQTLEGHDEEREKSQDQSEREFLEAVRLGKEKPIVRLINNIILSGIGQRASDIHLHPTRKTADLLYRIDGTLVKSRSFNKTILPALVSRIKIIGRMNIAERRLPQDGGARVIHKGKVVDLRISVIPTVDGESVVIRILNTEIGLKSVSELGFSPHDEAVFTDLLCRNNGLVLVTGPTGCGKSTTLYAAIGEVRKQNVNLITVEDPVEYHIDGVEQIQVNPVAGYTFAKALRHILRHDPDVIMIGEIRDQETGKIAIESALTGHLVLSTLHTNDAASAVTRLMEMGMEAYLLSATLLGVLAQRLVRRNCPHCVTEETVEPVVRKFLGVEDDEVFYRGGGCDKCNQTGFSGRLAVYELLRATPELRDRIQEGITSDELHEQALKDGMMPLTQNALAQARQRKIALAEAYRVRLE
jgi:type IV pilus assembly protein PilB